MEFAKTQLKVEIYCTLFIHLWIKRAKIVRKNITDIRIRLIPYKLNFLFDDTDEKFFSIFTIFIQYLQFLYNTYNFYTIFTNCWAIICKFLHTTYGNFGEIVSLLRLRRWLIKNKCIKYLWICKGARRIHHNNLK